MMHVRYATQAAPGKTVNEDHVLHAGPLVVVLDGVSVPNGMETGCLHDTPWYVTHLASRAAQHAAAAPEADLPHILAAAIGAVRDDHRGLCDLNHPGTPAAAIGMVRDHGDTIEYLILCDVTLVLDRCGPHPQVLTDERFSAAVADLRAHTLSHPTAFDSHEHTAQLLHITERRQQRTNRPGGYWIAAANPEAAHHAITGTIPRHGPHPVRRAALLTDGAADAVTRYKLLDWPTLLDLLTTSGPNALINRVRAAEHADTTGHAQPRYKRHDDATAALCTFHPPEQP